MTKLQLALDLRMTNIILGIIFFLDSLNHALSHSYLGSVFLLLACLGCASTVHRAHTVVKEEEIKDETQEIE